MSAPRATGAWFVTARGLTWGHETDLGAFGVRLAAIALGSAIALPVSAGGVAAAGLLASYQAYPVGSWPEAVAIGDVTGDGLTTPSS